jgi:hypothetical protein
MISELTDDEILDFLMTSDFEDNYKPEELKYLLLKWRYFYRVLHGKGERLKENIEFELKVQKDKNDVLEKMYNDSLAKIAEKENTINSMKTRHLSWKERISGKIILKDNEN